MGSSKKRKALVIIGIILFVLIVIPLAAVGISFIGRITPDSVIPDSFDIYASVPEPPRLAERILAHESLPDILALAELAPLIPVLEQLKSSGLAENRLLRYAAKGRLDAALLGGDKLLAAWDAGIMSPLLRFLPLLAGRITVPGLYYVKAGKNSRFEYRVESGVFYFGHYRNLFIISNDSVLYESVIAGSSRDGDRIGSAAKSYYSKDFDIAFLVSPPALAGMLADGGGADDLAAVFRLLRFPGPVEASVSVLPGKLKLRLVSPLAADNPALQKIIGRDSGSAFLESVIPASAQYLTLLSAGGLDELLNAASAVTSGTSGGDELDTALKSADNASRRLLGMNLDELLYSWAGSQFAVYGLPGRPHPVIAVEIRDEQKRGAVFDKAFRSIFLSEDTRLNLDGSRIPRIELPSFLASLLEFMDIHIPSPYYTVQNNVLFVSESAETLLAAVNAVRRSEVLPGTELWRALSEGSPGPASFSVFYSLDRSLPFFLNGSGAVTAILRLYRQGLGRVHLENRLLSVNLQVIPGPARGIVPLAGFPLDLAVQGGARTGNRLYRTGMGRDTRLLLTRGGGGLAVNPFDRSIKELAAGGAPGTSLHIVPADAEGAAWIVLPHGQVNLVNKELESLRGFPVSTGIHLSAPPAARGGKLFLPGEDGSVHTVDGKASVGRWDTVFSAPLRSPPSLADFNNRTYAAVYPKSFFGELNLLDEAGNLLSGWPVPVSGIAFGSPLLFTGPGSSLLTAFITQAGELTVYTETAETLPGFPLELEGVFYLQPVFDGEQLWIIESEGTLYSVNLSGEVTREKIPRFSVKENGYISAARGDSPDAALPAGVFFSGEGNALHGYSRDFSPLEGFPLPVWGKPVFGDLNGDGKAEVAGVSMDNKLHVWQFR